MRVNKVFKKAHILFTRLIFVLIIVLIVLIVVNPLWGQVLCSDIKIVLCFPQISHFSVIIYNFGFTKYFCFLKFTWDRARNDTHAHTHSVDLYYNLTGICTYVVNNFGGNLSRVFIPRDPDVRLNALTAGKKAVTNRLHREMKIFVLPTQEKLYPPTKKCEEKCPKPHHTHNGSIDIS